MMSISGLQLPPGSMPYKVHVFKKSVQSVGRGGGDWLQGL